ncbi:sucrose-6-phosphate hydrolase-like [Leptidea sinapis]|uniref:sucrose-6-phosphate hydrolase-like n=1 Tax=Leptidea sinapis TaxID=189913 RepID=UPI00213B510D|nr:sucrose-6-phosphate hydrolase-like [Leptidea sinapis]
MLLSFSIFAFVFLRNANAENNFYPRYHLAPEHGWMNDPNGFCIFNNEYHLFYQYNPNSSYVPGIAHWGHAVSKDLFHWKHLPIAMYPDQWYDEGGVFSGSALVDNGTMYLYYTGNVNHPNETPNHNQYQALAMSTDGINVAKYDNNPIINGTQLQPDLRDPKVWKHGDKYYMVLGNSFNDGKLGRALLYTSPDKINWEKASVLAESDGFLGYMFECPDFFEIDGYFVLLFSPQGIKPRGDKYRNLYQTGYLIGTFDYETNNFTVLSKFQEFDHGHDLYATQSEVDENGNRIVIAWFDMWDQNYPENAQGFTGQMTIPRVISVTNDLRLKQTPVQSISLARGRNTYSGRTKGGAVVVLEDNVGEVVVKAPRYRDFALFIESDSGSVKLSYDFKKGRVTLDRGGNDGVRRTSWRPQDKLLWKIYIDSSSIELFCGEGEVTFSSRFFPTGSVRLRLAPHSDAEEMIVNGMKHTVDITSANEATG